MKSRALLALVICAVLCASGCRRQPTAEQRLNRRALDAVLTAITLKNKRLLEESYTQAKHRRDAGQLTEVEFHAIDAFVAKARANDWAGAEKDAYRFRKEHPFIRAGQ